MDSEVRLAARPVTGMAFMKMRFVRNIQAFRFESFAQLFRDSLAGSHGSGNTHLTAFRQCPE
jgi:hypothetical protein